MFQRSVLVLALLAIPVSVASAATVTGDDGPERPRRNPAATTGSSPRAATTTWTPARAATSCAAARATT